MSSPPATGRTWLLFFSGPRARSRDYEALWRLVRGLCFHRRTAAAAVASASNPVAAAPIVVVIVAVAGARFVSAPRPTAGPTRSLWGAWQTDATEHIFQARKRHARPRESLPKDVMPFSWAACLSYSACVPQRERLGEGLGSLGLDAVGTCLDMWEKVETTTTKNRGS